MEPSLDPIQAWKEGKGSGLIVRLPPSERPLQGLGGKIDWIAQGGISKFLMSGILSGGPSERTLLPLRMRDRKLELLLCGGARDQTTPEEMRRILKLASGIKNIQWMISKSDFGGFDFESFDEAPWIVTQ